MTKYIVNSDRLNGLERGDVIDKKDLDGVNIEHLLNAGHLSTQDVKKSAKPKDTDTKE
jgi:hypothetical protein